MQYARDSHTLDQLSLFHNAWMASRARMTPLTRRTDTRAESARRQASHEVGSALPAETGYSEISLNGSPGQCLQWLAPVLRELSDSASAGWLTLVNPPLNVSLQWLRLSRLDPRRILVIRTRPGMDPLDLCCEVLEQANSHTVVSWLEGDARQRARLTRAAATGRCNSLNIKLQPAQAD